MLNRLYMDISNLEYIETDLLDAMNEFKSHEISNKLIIAILHVRKSLEAVKDVKEEVYKYEG